MDLLVSFSLRQLVCWGEGGLVYVSFFCNCGTFLSRFTAYKKISRGGFRGEFSDLVSMV